MVTDSLLLLLLPETGRRQNTAPSYEEIEGVSFLSIVAILGLIIFALSLYYLKKEQQKGQKISGINGRFISPRKNNKHSHAMISSFQMSNPSMRSSCVKISVEFLTKLKRYEFIYELVCNDVRVPIVLQFCANGLHCLGYGKNETF